MTEITDNTEEVIEEVVEEVVADGSDNGYNDLNEVEQILAKRQDEASAQKARERGETVEETVEEAIEEEVAEEVADEPEYVFELKDGTKLTGEDIEKGVMLHSDYTKKRQESSATESELAQYSGIINWLKDNPEAVEDLWERTKGNAPAQTQPAATNEIQIPAGYENEPAIKLLVGELNKNRAELAEIKGGVSTINQEKTEQQKRTDIDNAVNTRMIAAYDELKGQVETPPTPDEFQKRLFAHFEELGLSREALEAYITGDDPTYLSAKVERIFAADIGKKVQAKGVAVEKERKKRVAKVRTLGVGGKSKASAPQSLSKGKDGKIDPKAALVQIMDEQEKIARR